MNHSSIKECTFTNWYSAIRIERAENIRIDSCTLIEPNANSNQCIIIGASDTGEIGANCTICNCLLQGWQDHDDNKIYGKYGIFIKDFDAVFVENTDIGRFKLHDLYITGTSGKRCDNHHFSNCYFDVTAENDCVRITGPCSFKKSHSLIVGLLPAVIH